MSQILHGYLFLQIIENFDINFNITKYLGFLGIKFLDYKISINFAKGSTFVQVCKSLSVEVTYDKHLRISSKKLLKGG